MFREEFQEIHNNEKPILKFEYPGMLFTIIQKMVFS